MAQTLTDYGEEWLVTSDLTTSAVDVGLYNDSTDAITDPDDIENITTEPGDGNYTRQTSISVSANNISGDWSVITDSKVTFDLQNTTPEVDSYFFVVSFQAETDNDTTAQDHLIVAGSLSQTYDLNSVDTLEISAGTAGVSVD